MSKLSLDNRVVNILNHINAGVLYCKNDEHSTILYANDYFYQMIGYEKDEFAILFSNRFADLVMDDVSHILKSIDEKIARGEDLDFEFRMRNKQGEIFWVHDTAKYEQEYNCWYVTIMNITDMKSIEYEKERLEFYLNSMPNKIVICDQNANIIYRNKCAKECLYYNPEASSLHQLNGGNILGMQMEEVLRQASLGVEVNYETRFQENGTFIGHDKNRMIPIRSTDGKILNYMQVSEDLLSLSDGLTHFPTRAMFEDYYHYFTEAHSDQAIYMAIIDIDNFKNINDTYGHYVGDEVIRITGQRLSSVLGKEDYICRYGGDEFMILFVNQQLESVLDKCRYILYTALSTVQIRQVAIELSYSIGIASGEHASGYQDLMEKADHALYQVKENGKGCIIVYDKSKNKQGSDL